MKAADRKTVTIDFSVTVSVMLGVFVIYHETQNAFGFEENILALQTGIVSTANQDYAISQEFEARIIQDGRIMRLSGITSTGEQYYLYQKTVGDDVIVKGKIYVNNAFVPIIFNEKLLEQKTDQPDSDLIMVTKLSSYTYANYPFTISVKVFDGEINAQPRYDNRIGVLENVLVSVTLTDSFGEFVTSFSGHTDYTGVFQGSYLVLEDVVEQGEYNVDVTIDDGTSSTTKSFTTFFRGDIRDYFHDTN